VPLCHGMMRRSEHYRYGTGLPANLGLPLLEIIKRKNYQDIFRTIQ
jgi:hypothetical protein